MPICAETSPSCSNLKRLAAEYGRIYAAANKNAALGSRTQLPASNRAGYARCGAARRGRQLLSGFGPVASFRISPRQEYCGR
jgi:hypothetical protein